MWIGEAPLRRLLVVGSLLLGGCRAGDDAKVDPGRPAAAWWYDIAFEPRSTLVRGIALSALDEAWRYADALTPSDLEGRISEEELRRFRASPLAFSVSADLDHDGVTEEFFVGVFATAAGSRGRFVAITRNGGLVRHFTEEGSAGFSALLRGDGEVRWYKCMDCGEFESIVWTGGSYALE